MANAPFISVKTGALSAEAREVLAMADDNWRRIPMRRAAIVSELERMGFVVVETHWQWSTRNPGAGMHVVMWRRNECRGQQ